MDIITNSLYLNCNIFLRELVLNAANACNKERFLSIGCTNARPSITIRSNRDRRAVMIKDSGGGA
jgi:HSP90 family molecular chaperone